MAVKEQFKSTYVFFSNFSNIYRFKFNLLEDSLRYEVKYNMIHRENFKVVFVYFSIMYTFQLF